jgi:hypothetical protein
MCDSGTTIKGGQRRHLDLSDSEVEEGVAFSHLDDGFWTDAAHTCTETTVEFEDSEFIEKCRALCFPNIIIVDNLLGFWRLNAIPFTI